MSKYLCWQPLTFADFLPRSSSLSGSYPEVLLLIWPWCISFLSASSSLSVNDSSLWVRCSLRFNPKSSCVSWSHRTELWLVTLDSSLGKKAFLLFCKHQELHDCIFSHFLSCIHPHSMFLDIFEALLFSYTMRLSWLRRLVLHKIFIFVLVVCQAHLFFCVFSNEQSFWIVSISLYRNVIICLNVSSHRSIICFLSYWAVMEPKHGDRLVILK